MPPLLALVVANLPAIVKSGQTVVEFIRRERQVAVQSGEWTDAHEAEFSALLAAAGRSPAWQPDK
jgi:hypothetical protein